MNSFKHLAGRAQAVRKAARRASENSAIERARRERTFAETVSFLAASSGPIAEESHQTSAALKAHRIINAGATARSGGPPRPAPSGFAAQILAAGEKRRRPFGGK